MFGPNTPVVAFAGPLDVSMSSTADRQSIELCDLDGGR
jgi:hypothetical protein